MQEGKKMLRDCLVCTNQLDIRFFTGCYCLFILGALGSETGQWVHLRNEDPPQGWHASEGPGGTKIPNYHVSFVSGPFRCHLLLTCWCFVPFHLRSLMFGQSATSSWKRTILGLWRCSTPSKTPSTSISSWNSFPEVGSFLCSISSMDLELTGKLTYDLPILVRIY